MEQYKNTTNWNNTKILVTGNNTKIQITGNTAKIQLIIRVHNNRTTHLKQGILRNSWLGVIVSM